MIDNQMVKNAAIVKFNDYMGNYDSIDVISIATTDGFPVYTKCVETLEFDFDALAAASSTLYSVSNAVSKQILNKEFSITFIEAEQGNVGFVSLSFSERDFVLAMSTNDSMNIGQLRVLINRLAIELESMIERNR